MKKSNIPPHFRSLIVSLFCIAATPLFGDLPVTNGLVTHIDPSSGSYLRLDTGGRVEFVRSARWHGAVGHGTYMRQADPDHRPEYIASEPGSFNGHPFLRFDGFDYLTYQRSVGGIWQDAPFTSDGLHVIVVARSEAGDGGGWQALMGWDSFQDYDTPETGDDRTFRPAVNRLLGWETGAPVPFPQGEVFEFSAGFPQDGISLMSMGAKRFSETGPTNPLKGDIAEVLIYDRKLEDGERIAVLQYLHGKYGLPTDISNPTADVDPRNYILKDLVPESSNFQIGAAANSNFYRWSQYLDYTVPDGAAYPATASTLKRQFHIITPTNDFKLDKVGKNLGKHDSVVPHDWEETDPYVAYAHENGIEVRGHTLVWHNANPPVIKHQTWKNGQWTEAEIRTLLFDHIDEMVGRYTSSGAMSQYAGTVTHWDVVNEAINGSGWSPADSWRTAIRRGAGGENIWMDGGDGDGGRPGLGDHYIDEAFHRAHDAANGDEIDLFYNDFSCTFDTPEDDDKADAIYAMCVDLIANGVPIDGVGFQMHINYAEFQPEQFRKNVARFKALTTASGEPFKVVLTELDIGIPGLVTREKLEQQGAVAAQITRISLEEGVDMLMPWGVTETWSSVWKANNGWSEGLPFTGKAVLDPGVPTGPDHPAYTDSYFVPKPFFMAMYDTLNNHDWGGGSSVPVEAGEVETSHEWTAVGFASAFTEAPVVVTGPVSHEGWQPAVAEIRNVTKSGFEVRVAEPLRYDGIHVQETVCYLAVERGLTGIGGLEIRAGLKSGLTDSPWRTAGFSGNDFPPGIDPVVFTTYERRTWDHPAPVAIRVRDITRSGFDFYPQREEALEDDPGDYRLVHFVAIEPGATSGLNFDLKAGRTPMGATSSFTTTSFGGSFGFPLVWARILGFAGPDTALLRYRNLDSTSVEFSIQEEASADAETGHINEDLGWMVIGN